MHVVSSRGALVASRDGHAGAYARARSRDELALWPLVHLRRLLRDEAQRLYRAAPSPESLGRLDRSAKRLGEAERALARSRSAR